MSSLASGASSSLEWSSNEPLELLVRDAASFAISSADFISLFPSNDVKILSLVRLVCILILKFIGLRTPDLSNFGNSTSFAIGSVLPLVSPNSPGIVLDDSGRERNACGGGVGGGLPSLLLLLIDLTDDLSE